MAEITSLVVSAWSVLNCVVSTSKVEISQEGLTSLDGKSLDLPNQIIGEMGSNKRQACCV